MNEQLLEEKVARLTLPEKMRLAKIMLAIPQLIHALVECQSPDDARIALCSAVGTVFGIQTLADIAPFQLMMSQAQLAEVTIDFVIEALIARRKR